jgi:hypothetical protein
MMKKLSLFLALALLVPAMANVATITITDQDGTGPGLVGDVNYTADVNVVGFALKLQSDDANIVDFVQDINGESVAGNIGYGIFPGTVQISGGNITDAGTPVAPSTDPGAEGTGLGTKIVVIEMGSLYADDANKPPLAGKLGEVTTDGPCYITVTAEVAYRGGVVNEDVAQVALDPSGGEIESAAPTCRSLLTSTEQALYDRYVLEGEDPTSWCWQYQCYGDGTNSEQGTLVKVRIGSNDLSVLLGSWNLKPESGANPDADYDHAEQGTLVKVSTGSNDLSVLLANWQKKDGDLSNCPTYLP